MQKVAKEYTTTMKAAAVQARLKAGQSPIKATASSISQPDIIQQCFAARDGRLLGLLVSLPCLVHMQLVVLLCHAVQHQAIKHHSAKLWVVVMHVGHTGSSITLWVHQPSSFA